MKTLLIIIFSAFSISAQSYEVVNINGTVEYQSGSEEIWVELNKGEIIGENSVISTGESSFVELEKDDITFRLNELSVVSVKNIKKISRDELLLALALEDILNSPKKNGDDNSSSTAVYGSNENGISEPFIKSDDFGIRRLNGAVQLAKNGLEESAVVAARETYRKYPDVKSIPSYRIYFSSILTDKGLYEEALGEYLSVQQLELTNLQREEVESKIEKINQVLLNN